MISIEKGSGNIFKDLGYENAEEALTKASIAYKINSIIKQRGYTQNEAAKILNIDQPKISYLNNGKLRGFSLERLFSFLNALDYEVKVIIKEKKPTKFQHDVEIIDTYPCL